MSEKTWCKPNDEFRQFTADETEQVFELVEQYENIRFGFVDILNELREEGSFAFIKLKPKFDNLEKSEIKFAQSLEKKFLTPNEMEMSKICELTESIETQQQEMISEIGKIKIRKAAGLQELLPIQEKIRRLTYEFGKKGEEEGEEK